MDYPKISIVTPSYNQAEYLEKTILSVINQNYPNLEYIIMDGGSTDRSIEIIKKYEKYITYWVSENDNGQYDAINKGFKQSTGVILGWLNSSDVFYPWTLQTICEIFAQNIEIKWLTGLPSHIKNGEALRNVSKHFYRNKFDFLAGNYNWIQQESTFWTREIWEKIGGLDLKYRYAGDLNLWTDFFKLTELYHVNTILGSFRFHETRRGSDINYNNEVKKILDEFEKFYHIYKFKIKLIHMITRKGGLLKDFISTFQLFSWYKHYKVFFDFDNDSWVIK